MIKGNLKDKDISAALLELYTRGATGTLRLKRDNGLKSIFFQMGKPIFASSNLKEDRMGAMLYKKQLINKEQLEWAIEEIKKTGKKLGTVLVEEGIITPEQLVEIVIAQVEEIIISTFEWDSGEYFFSDDTPTQEDIITLEMSAAQIIVKGVKTRLPMQKIRKTLGSQRNILGFTRNPSYRFKEIELTREEEEILSYVNGKNSIHDIQEKSGTDEETCYRMLAALMLLKSIEVVGEQKVAPVEEPLSELSEMDEGEDLELELESSSSEDLITSLEEVVMEAPPEKPKHSAPKTVPPPKPHASKRNPQDAKKFFEKGRALFQEGETELALNAFKRAIALDPTVYEYYTGLGLLYASKAEEDQEYEMQALDCFKKAVTLNPKESRNYYYIGVIFKNREEYEKARNYFKKALNLNPDFKQAEQQLRTLED
ncbi:MAG TPA: DUF4388 domain-containing protein [bacterium]